MYKVKDIFLKLATNGQSDKAFLLTSEFCPQRVVCPCPGAIYMWKNIKKMCIKSEFKEICYAPNFEEVDGAYWFRVVRPSMRPSVQEPCMLGF